MKWQWGEHIHNYDDNHDFYDLSETFNPLLTWLPTEQSGNYVRCISFAALITTL